MPRTKPRAKRTIIFMPAIVILSGLVICTAILLVALGQAIADAVDGTMNLRPDPEHGRERYTRPERLESEGWSRAFW